MATYACKSTIRKTLTGVTVDLVKCTTGGVRAEMVTVANLVGTDDLVVTWSPGVNSTPATPAADADGVYTIPSGMTRTFRVAAGGAGTAGFALHVLGNGNKYEIERAQG